MASAATGIAGLAVAVAGYQQMSAPLPDPGPTSTTAAQLPQQRTALAAPVEVRDRFRDCPPGHVLKQRACVRVVERTVVVDVTAPSGQQPAAAAPAPAVVAAHTPQLSTPGDHSVDDGGSGEHGDDRDQEEAEDHEDHEDEDHEDGDHEDGDHEDGDHEDGDHEDGDHEEPEDGEHE